LLILPLTPKFRLVELFHIDMCDVAKFTLYIGPQSSSFTERLELVDRFHKRVEVFGG
jgi:hypothetical protein